MRNTHRYREREREREREENMRPDAIIHVHAWSVFLNAISLDYCIAKCNLDKCHCLNVTRM